MSLHVIKAIKFTSCVFSWNRYISDETMAWDAMLCDLQQLHPSSRHMPIHKATTQEEITVYCVIHCLLGQNYTCTLEDDTHYRTPLCPTMCPPRLRSLTVVCSVTSEDIKLHLHFINNLYPSHSTKPSP